MPPGLYRDPKSGKVKARPAPKPTFAGRKGAQVSFKAHSPVEGFLHAASGVIHDFSAEEHRHNVNMRQQLQAAGPTDEHIIEHTLGGILGGIGHAIGHEAKREVKQYSKWPGYAKSALTFAGPPHGEGSTAYKSVNGRRTIDLAHSKASWDAVPIPVLGGAISKGSALIHFGSKGAKDLEKMVEVIPGVTHVADTGVPDRLPMMVDRATGHVHPGPVGMSHGDIAHALGRPTEDFVKSHIYFPAEKGIGNFQVQNMEGVNTNPLLKFLTTLTGDADTRMLGAAASGGRKDPDAELRKLLDMRWDPHGPTLRELVSHIGRGAIKTVPKRPNVHNPQFGWQLIRGGLGATWDAQQQRRRKH